MSTPLAYLLTWTTYGTWLPGDSRGWVKDGEPGIQEANPRLEKSARQLLAHAPVTLEQKGRAVVERTIRDHCHFREWTLHAVNVRSNPVYVVVSAPIHPDQVLGQFKAWCSRRLNEDTKNPPEHWWRMRGGSTKWINDEEYLENAIRYVLEGQDRHAPPEAARG